MFNATRKNQIAKEFASSSVVTEGRILSPVSEKLRVIHLRFRKEDATALDAICL